MRVAGVKTKTGDRRGTLLLGYFISYIIIITILFVAIGGYSYSNIVRVNMDKMTSELRFNMQKYMDSLDRDLRNAMDVAVSFYNNRELSRLRKLPEGFAPNEYIGFKELSSTLSLHTNTFIERVTLYFHYNQLFIASDMVETRPLVYYNLQSFGSRVNYDAWRLEQTEQAPGSFYVPAASSGRTVNLYYRLPYGDKEKGVTVITALQIADMLESFGFSDPYRNAAVFLTDNGGNVLYVGGSMAETLLDAALTSSPAESLEADGIRYQWYTEESSLTDWSLHFFVDRRELDTGVTDMQKSLLAVYFSALVVSLLLAAMFAKSTSDPVESILRIIDGQGKGPFPKTGTREKTWRFLNGNRLHYAWQRVSDISESNTKLTRQVMNYRETSRDVFFHKLLSGDAMLPEEVVLGQERETKLFEYSSFTVAIANILAPRTEGVSGKREGASNTLTEAALDYLHAAEREGIYVHRFSESQIAVIVCSSREQTRDELTGLVQNIYEQADSRKDVRVNWGVGATVYNTDQIFASCQNAISVLVSMGTQENGSVVWYEDNKTKPVKLRYRAEDEQRLINAMTQGDAETAKRVVSEIIAHNGALLEASEAQCNQIVAAFSETFYRMENLLADMSEEREKELMLYLWQMKNMREPDLIANYLFMIIDLFCDIVSTRNENRYQELMKEIYAYIDESYGDADLCLSSIANRFYLTENYISTFFKQNSGVNISQYIEKVRMRHAAALLKETDLGAMVIAERIGYGNINTFYKAFKRYHGINPKAFRSG